MVAVGDSAANSLLESAQKLQMSAFGRRQQQEAWVAPVWPSQASYRADSQLSLLLTASRRQSGKGTWVGGEDVEVTVGVGGCRGVGWGWKGWKGAEAGRILEPLWGWGLMGPQEAGGLGRAPEQRGGVGDDGPPFVSGQRGTWLGVGQGQTAVKS